MHAFARPLALALPCLALARPMPAQPAPASPSSTAVDRVVQISGVFHPADGQAVAAAEVVTLSIYAEETGGSPLWQETQRVAVDSEGRYTVLLGSTSDSGLPVELFATGEPRWLGLQFQRAGEKEQPRTLATSVPYALRAAKASDADTLGGRPASDYQLAEASAGSAEPASGLAAGAPAGVTPSVSSGTVGRIGKFVNASDLGDSAMFESAGRIGLGTTAPLDVMHTRFTNTTGAVAGFAVQNLGSTATSYSGMLFYDHTGALRQFQGFNNSTKEYRINNIAPGGSINFMLGSTSRFFVAPGGRIGLGQTAPAHQLDVQHAGFDGIRSRSTAGSSWVDIDAASGDALLRFSKANAVLWTIANDGANDNLRIHEVIPPNLFERMRIEKGTGRVVLTGSGATEQLVVQGNVRIGTGATGCVLDADGTAIAGTCSSDLRFKRDVTSFGATLDRLVSLTPVHYYWRAAEFPERGFGTAQSYGLIAQDVEKAFPDLVTLDDNGYRAVNYSKLPLLTVQAVKELKAENDALEARLSALEAALKAMQKP